MKRILYCKKDDLFTLKETCPTCGETTITTQPPKYSVDDKYASYRREAKRPARKEAGLL
ncbi:ribosome biogenesis protein [Candidatus Woesearchaeota archaeon]|nr:ribosome biogenesis protein [Candidatus Woesearchaeota archaeon]